MNHKGLYEVHAMKHNVILIGFMGSGKTSVGIRLAERLSYRFCDSDQMIEKKVAKTINQIFSLHGEEHFRNLETELLKELSVDMTHHVLSTGGGLPMRKQNGEQLQEMGFVVFLKATKETTVQRLKGDTSRPLLKGEELEQKVERMLSIRTPIYEKAAHKIIATDGRSIDEIVNLIMESYIRVI